MTKLDQKIMKIVHLYDVAKYLAGGGSKPVGSTPREFEAHIPQQVAKRPELM